MHLAPQWRTRQTRTAIRAGTEVDGGDGGSACVAQTLDAVLALRQLKRAFPQASDSACRAALAVRASFAAAAVHCTVRR